MYAALEGTASDQNGVATWPTAAAYGNNVSIAEVLGFVQDGVRKASGTAVASTKSLVDAIGFDGTAAVASTAGMLRTVCRDRVRSRHQRHLQRHPEQHADGRRLHRRRVRQHPRRDHHFRDGRHRDCRADEHRDFDRQRQGATGAGGPSVLAAVSGLGANKTVIAGYGAANEFLPLVLESTKKLYIHGDDAGGSGAGVTRLTLCCRRMSDGASLAAGGIGS